MSEIVDNQTKQRFELAIDGSDRVAVAHYCMEDDRIVLTHTIVPEQFSGRGIASDLARGVFDYIRSNGGKVILICPFMSAFYERHPEYADIVAAPVPGEAR